MSTLFLVATPIGNLEDITFRALRVLREVAVIAAEDTRRTAGLLAHFDIHTPTLSFHSHNDRDRLPQLLEKLRSGEDIALVTDAGTPVISDPGDILVQAVREAGAQIVVVPGASAVLTALVTSGLPADSFTFLGFAPARRGERLSWIRALAAEPRTTIFFEAPSRILETLGAFREVLPDRTLAVARELTKVHEQVLVGTADTVLNRLTELRGEFTVVVGPPPPDEAPAPAEINEEELWREFCSLTAEAGRQSAGRGRNPRPPARPATQGNYAALEQAKIKSRAV